MFGGGFSDFFRTIFGGMSAEQAGMPRQRQTYEQPVNITFEEAYNGATRQLRTEQRKLSVHIPAGVKSGSKIRVAGGAPDGGDIYLKVNVAEDARFERDGNDLKTQTTVDVFTALLGGEADVQTMTGKVKLTIPPGTQPEQVFRLSGRGMPQLKSAETKGDLYVKVKVKIPRRLSDEQKQLLEKMKRLQKSE